MLGNFGMTDLPNFVTFDDSTTAIASLPTVSSMSVSAGTPSDTVSKANPMPGPTNSTYTMGRPPVGTLQPTVVSNIGSLTRPWRNRAGGSNAMGITDMPSMMGLSTPSSRRKIQNAEWSKPSYNYTRTQRAETDSTNTLGVAVASGLIFVGLYGVLKMIDTDFDDSGLLTGSVSATP
jgi:hypothetical protein